MLCFASPESASEPSHATQRLFYDDGRSWNFNVKVASLIKVEPDSDKICVWVSAHQEWQYSLSTDWLCQVVGAVDGQVQVDWLEDR